MFFFLKKSISWTEYLFEQDDYFKGGNIIFVFLLVYLKVWYLIFFIYTVVNFNAF